MMEIKAPDDAIVIIVPKEERRVPQYPSWVPQYPSWVPQYLSAYPVCPTWPTWPGAWRGICPPTGTAFWPMTSDITTAGTPKGE
jgi:hypothetical protein